MVGFSPFLAVVDEEFVVVVVVPLEGFEDSDMELSECCVGRDGEGTDDLLSPGKGEGVESYLYVVVVHFWVCFGSCAFGLV